jgi:hypothetical protein
MSERSISKKEKIRRLEESIRKNRKKKKKKKKRNFVMCNRHLILLGD